MGDHARSAFRGQGDRAAAHALAARLVGLQGYPRGDRFHSGVDLLGAAGTAVRAAGAGMVTFAGWDPGGYGNLVVIRHGAGTETTSFSG